MTAIPVFPAVGMVSLAGGLHHFHIKISYRPSVVLRVWQSQQRQVNHSVAVRNQEISEMHEVARFPIRSERVSVSRQHDDLSIL